MSKKSRKRAARYSELSRAKQKKRRQLTGTPPEAKATPATETQPKETREVVAPKEAAPKKVPATSAVKPPGSKAAPKTQAERKITLPGYQYVRDDLKRVGILTAAIIVILIILAFVLG